MWSRPVPVSPIPRGFLAPSEHTEASSPARPWHDSAVLWDSAPQAPCPAHATRAAVTRH